MPSHVSEPFGLTEQQSVVISPGPGQFESTEASESFSILGYCPSGRFSDNLRQFRNVLEYAGMTGRDIVLENLYLELFEQSHIEAFLKNASLAFNSTRVARIVSRMRPVNQSVAILCKTGLGFCASDTACWKELSAENPVQFLFQWEFEDFSSMLESVQTFPIVILQSSLALHEQVVGSRRSLPFQMIPYKKEIVSAAHQLLIRLKSDSAARVLAIHFRWKEPREEMPMLSRAIEQMNAAINKSRADKVFLATNADSTTQSLILTRLVLQGEDVLVGCPAELDSLCREEAKAQAIEQTLMSMADAFMRSPQSSDSQEVMLLRRFRFREQAASFWKSLFAFHRGPAASAHSET
jgi:hypothetical protein